MNKKFHRKKLKIQIEYPVKSVATRDLVLPICQAF